MKRWMVVTPEFAYTEWVCEMGGPTYDVRDAIEIEAETKRDALALGVKAMLADHCHYDWCRDQRCDRRSPYAGVQVWEAE